MDFLVFSDDWGRHPTTCEHLFRALLPEHRVIWVNTIGTRTPGLSLYDLRRAAEKLRAYRSKQETSHPSHPNLTVLSPSLYPFNQWIWCRRYNRASVKKTVERAINDRGFKGYTVLTSLPTTADFLKDHPHRTKVYYRVDDFTGMPGVNRKLIDRMERELIDVCDLHLYTAHALADKLPKNAVYLPHAVDPEHFRGSGRAELPRKPKPPVVGFFGHISRWIDISMLHELITAHPHWTFLFVGGHDVNVSSLKNHTNVMWIGAVPYDEIPQYGRWFDVGLIPYLSSDPRLESVNPVKLREYLALGLPVVSIPLPEIEASGSEVYLARGAEQFGEAIERALKEDTAEKRLARLGLARQNSWTDRGRVLVQAIENQSR